MTSTNAIAGSRVLVTGGSGFIGRHVVAELSAAGAHVRVIDLQPHPDPGVELVQGDLADAEVLAAALDGGLDYVVHLAAVTSVLRSLEQPELTYRTNVAATHGLLEGARQAGVKALVFASTNAVTGPMEAPAITEQARLRPLTPYGATKAAGEMLMWAYTASFGVRCVYIRLTNVYGPGMQAKDSIVARLMRCIRLGTTFEIYGDGTQVRDYVHAHDVVAAIKLALTDKRWQGPTVIGTGHSISVLDVVEQVRKVSGAELPVRHGPAKPGEMPAVIVDNAQARSQGWIPRYGFAEGVAGVWEEWRNADIEGVGSAGADPIGDSAGAESPGLGR
ncbi:MAG: NAD-dependent epimerase/dehydratase family protein [Solirubrobacteraceae bacterium]